MVDKSIIIDRFAEMSLLIPEQVIDKFAELCEEYNIDENEMVDTWFAYATSTSENVNPTVDTINMMVRKRVLVKNSEAREKMVKTALSIYSRSSFHPPENEDPSPRVTPKRTKPKTFEEGREELIRQVHSPRMLFSQDSFSPKLVEDSKTYTERTNSGETISRIGTDLGTCTWRTKIYFHPPSEIADNFCALDNEPRYMYCSLLEQVQAIRKRVDTVCLDILKNHEVKFPVEAHHITMETATYAGRVVCDGNGKLNANSILLDSCLFNKRGESVELDVTNIPEYSFFPGQVVVVEGRNPTGLKIIAEKLYINVKLPMCPPLKPNINIKEPLQIVVAAGPYTLNDSLCYQPFTDLLNYVVDRKPHALVLIGPLVDYRHPNIDFSAVAFSDCYSTLVSTLLQSLAETHTKVILSSNWREAAAHIIYPTPPPTVKLTNPNLMTIPDPCIVDIAGFYLGLTSADILMHLGKEELFKSSSGVNTQRLPRLASHLYQQKCFYPLVPPAEGMCLDTPLLTDHGQIPYKPHVLILPSDLKCFIKEINGSVVINPEKLTKGLVGGSFATIEVKPAIEGESWSPSTHICAQVVKI